MKVRLGNENSFDEKHEKKQKERKLQKKYHRQLPLFDENHSLKNSERKVQS